MFTEGSAHSAVCDKNTVTHYKASCIAACASSRRRIPIRLEFHCWYSCFFSKPMACKIHAHNYFPPCSLSQSKSFETGGVTVAVSSCSLSQSKSGETGGIAVAVSSCSLSLSPVKLVGSLWLGGWHFISFYSKVVPE